MQRTRIACGALALAFCFACGGSSAKNAAPAGNNALTLSTGPLVDGVEWQLNRPIDITFDRAIDFGTVTLANVTVELDPGAIAVAGSYELGFDPTTGATDARTVRFQPHCPIGSADTGGFAQGATYRLVVRGEDSTTFPVRAQDGTALASTVTVSFATPTSSDPGVLYFDSVVGAPRVVFRGRQGVPTDDPNGTRFEIGRAEQTRVELRASTFGGVVVDPGSLALVPNGLPLNHIVEPNHHIALVVEFDQAVRLEPANLDRLELQFLDATWSVVPCAVEARSGCGRRGSTVSVRPLATLPPGAPLRLVLRAGFTDLVGDSLTIDAVEVLPFAGTTVQVANGARVDALFESFQVGGNQPGSMEDATSDLGAPRGFWGSGFVAGVAAPGGISKVRSKWYAVGLAGFDGGSTPEAPEFWLSGTDAQGVVRAANGQVVLEPAIVGSLPPAALGTFTAEITAAQVSDPAGLRSALPSILRGDRARLGPDPTPGSIIQAQIFGVEPAGANVSMHLGYGCYAPGFQLDCVPWNLSNLFPSPSAATLDVSPQSFEVYTWIHRDAHHSDHRVTLRFDATRRDASGRPDPGLAHSVASGWATHVSQLSGAAWDFLRFEIQFELDVSGDGYSPLERSPALDFIKIPVDFRR